MASKILRINLTTNVISKEDEKDYSARFLGGRGVGSWILFNELPEGTDALDPSNIVIFSTGPLSGTSFPGSARLSIESKNYLTGGVNWSNVGGFFSAEMSHTGWNHIIITGKANKPVYIYVKNDNVEIRNAAHIWGANIWETEDIIRYELKDPQTQIASIGIAGENLVHMAIVITNRTRAAGSGGLGAVMGSKNLKALAIRGTLKRELYDSRRFELITKELSKKIKNSKMSKSVRKNGTLGTFINPVNDVCAYPYRNTQDDHYENLDISRISWSKWNKTKQIWDSCFNCPIKCGRYIMEADDGPYAGLKVPMPENNTYYAFGTRLDMSSPSYILKAFEMISKYGLDNDATAVAISWAFECYEKGILTKKDTDGLELLWGKDPTVISLIRKIAYKEGFGEILSKGCKKASEIIGKNSMYYCTAIKGQDNLDALRACKGWALGNIVSLRGGRHLDGAPATELDPGNSRAVSKKLFGVDSAYIPNTYKDKGRLVSWFSHFKAVIDSLGVCYFTSWWSSPEHCGPSDYASALSASTGDSITGEKLLEIGERIYNVEKAFNVLHAGFMRKDDYPPAIFIDEPVKSGKYKGERLERKEYDKMLNEFYKANNWDPISGIQYKNSLLKLDLPEVAARLEKKRKLLENSNGA